MIESDGLQPFTMEALARTASVSSSLVYNYFSSRLALSREQLAMSREVAAKRLEAENFESIGDRDFNGAFQFRRSVAE